MINEIREFISACPYISGRTININYLDSRIGSLSLEVGPARKVIKEYTDGDRLCSVSFVLAAREGSTKSVSGNSAAMVMFENFAAWLDEQSRLGKLPKLCENLVPLSILSETGFTVKSVSDLAARYETGFELYYCEKGL